MISTVHRVASRVAMAFLLCFVGVAFAAPKTENLTTSQSPMEYLEGFCPKLFGKYKDEIGKYVAHYIFAVDVSGTMKRFEPYVVPSLKAFFNALPDGDMVTVIPFGTEILNLPGYAGTINSSMRKNLADRAEDLYSNSNLTKDFKKHTDVKKAIDAVASAVRNNRDYNINILVVMTDFRNDVPKDDERPLKANELEDLYGGFNAAIKGLYTRNIALELPYIDASGKMSTEKNRAMKGYCLNQLRDKVFPQEGDGKLQTVPIGNSPEAINHWFVQLQRDIMVTKLQAVIRLENNVAPATVETEVDIDGNVVAKVDWTPTKLYPNLKIDSSYFANEEWFFENDKDSWQMSKDSHIELKLGQAKHRELGFHNNVDSLKLGLSLPTAYDNELELLNIQKLIPETKAAIGRWLFTFPIPFWLCCVIVTAILIYSYLFLKAVKRNKSLKLACKVTLIDLATEEEFEISRRLDKLESLSIPGSQGIKMPTMVPWAVKIYKKKGNPFLLFEEPCFVWESQKSYVFTRFGTKGKLAAGINTLYAGPRPKTDKATHQLKIRRF